MISGARGDSGAPEQRRRDGDLEAEVKQREPADLTVHHRREQTPARHARKRRAGGQAYAGAQIRTRKRHGEHDGHGQPEASINGAHLAPAGRTEFGNVELAGDAPWSQDGAKPHQQSQDKGEEKRCIVQRKHAEIVGDPPAQRFHAAPARISLRGARAAYVGPGLDLAPHRNAVALVAIGLEAPFDLALMETRTLPVAHVPLRAALVPPGQLHHLRARGRMAFVYLDALSDDYSALQASHLDRLVDAIPEIAAGATDVDDVCARVGLPPRASQDSRIAALLRAIDVSPEEFPNLAVAARAAGLSSSRCRALIREAVGMSFTRYRLWRRMGRVCRELAATRSLTEAAHAAGFASSAHLSTAFRHMFGLSPSMLMRTGVQFDVN